MKKEGNKQLFKDFPEISTAAWEEKINTDLKGAEARQKLTRKTDDGIGVKPFYRSEDIEVLNYLENVNNLRCSGSSPNGWTICQDIFPDNDPKETNTLIKSALKGGAQAIRIQLQDRHSQGLEVLGTLLEGVPLGEIELLFQGFTGADALYSHLCELARIGGVDPIDLKGSLGADPLGKMMSDGYPIASLENMGKLVRSVSEKSPGMRVIDIHGGLIQNSGSTLVQELGFALAMANDYMVLLTSQGIDPVLVQDSMQLNLSVGSDYFMEIAKLRVARILWGNIAGAYGIESSGGKIRIHSTSSEWNLSLFDPYVNMLRGTTEAMSSILGGADLISVLPFDYSYGMSNEFSDRISRNVQIILLEESYLDRVADPASGSYYIENLTDSVGEKSWMLFREVESKGGFRKAFESGWIQEQVIVSRKKKIERAATGRDKILGTNAFPDFNEMILDNLNTTGSGLQKTGSGFQKTTSPLQPPDTATRPPDMAIRPLIPFRVSSIFEEVRLETERSSKRPKVLLFKYGNPAWMTSRATFSGNFFACAGYEILDHPAFSTIESGVQIAKDQNADIVVLCSSDDTYSELAPAVYAALKDRSVIVVAGYPAESMDALRKAGIEHFIHMKINLLNTLREFNKLLL